MARSLAGRTALVTGAAKRLGRDIALMLAESGANVVVHYDHSESEAEEVASACKAKGVGAWCLQAHFDDPATVERLVPEAVKSSGVLDIVINNASIFPEDTFVDFTIENVQQNVKINAVAPTVLGRSFAQLNRPGDIINLLDTRITDRDPKHFSYHLSKRMLFTLTRWMAVEFAPDIRVNAVAPGLVLPPEGQDETYLDSLKESNPMNTHGEGGDVAHAVKFLLESEFTTGQVVFVDGGRHMLGGVYD